MSFAPNSYTLAASPSAVMLSPLPHHLTTAHASAFVPAPLARPLQPTGCASSHPHASYSPARPSNMSVWRISTRMCVPVDSRARASVTPSRDEMTLRRRRSVPTSSSATNSNISISTIAVPTASTARTTKGTKTKPVTTATSTNSSKTYPSRTSRTTTSSASPSPSSSSACEDVLAQWQGAPPSRQVQVQIERPRADQRVVSAANLINAPLEVVWELLSDYDNLSQYIPNLVESRLCAHPTGGIRLSQCGAQRILGFQFRAALVMDMREAHKDSDRARAIHFSLVSSKDFKQFSGSWTMVSIGDDGNSNGDSDSYQNGSKTALFYTVSIVPKGLVPVAAIEWRIAEDVPENMDAVRLECERRRRVAVAAANAARMQQQQRRREGSQEQ